MSTRENIRLIARAPMIKACLWIGVLLQFHCAIFKVSLILSDRIVKIKTD